MATLFRQRSSVRSARQGNASPSTMSFTAPFIAMVWILLADSTHGDLVAGLDPPSIYVSYTPASRVFINEMHIANAGQDIDEGIEIVGPAGTDITGWTVTFYSSSGGLYASSTVASPNNFDPVVIPDQQNGFGTYFFTKWLGSSDVLRTNGGVALSDANGTLIQFIGFTDGSFLTPIKPTTGPANGVSSDIIPLRVNSNAAVGSSMQLIGTGYKVSDFTWAYGSKNTYNAVNANQTLKFPSGFPWPGCNIATISNAIFTISFIGDTVTGACVPGYASYGTDGLFSRPQVTCRNDATYGNASAVSNPCVRVCPGETKFNATWPLVKPGETSQGTCTKGFLPDDNVTPTVALTRTCVDGNFSVPTGTPCLANSDCDVRRYYKMARYPRAKTGTNVTGECLPGSATLNGQAPMYSALI
eukprot:Opistho-2@32401